MTQHGAGISASRFRSSRAVRVLAAGVHHPDVGFHVEALVAFAIDWPLRDLAALLAGSMFIGHDSGVSHLAAATGGASLVLFGPTDPEIWAPRNENARVLLAPNRELEQLPLAIVCDAINQELMRIGIRT